MEDRTILITGATSGIGKAAATELAKTGARVVITYRDRMKGEKTRDEITRITGNDRIHMLYVDLASLATVRELAENFRREFGRLDVLINNAGGYFGYRKTTAEGFEYTFGVNHLAHFLLTNLLKDLLQASKSRIINVSSQGQIAGRIHFDDLMLNDNYHGFKAYAQAKLANIMFTYELDRRWGGSGITTNAVHPGAVATNFGTEARPVFRFLIRMGKPFLKSPRSGARSIVYLATSSEAEGITGKYFAYGRPFRSRAVTYDRTACTRLWEMSEEWTGAFTEAAQESSR